MAGQGRRHGRAQAHHRRGRPRSRSRDHHLSRGQPEEPGAAVREHQGPSRPSRALQHDRLQPVAVLPDDRRGADGSSAASRAGAAEEDGPHHEAQGGLGRDRDLQPEHRDRRRHRHPAISGAAHVAARRRALSRHRRRGGDAMPGDRPHQCRHLSHDDQRAARDRRLYLARQGRHARPREVVEAGQADADRRGLRHRSAVVPGRGDELSENRKRIRILRRHQRRADRVVQERRHRPAAAGAAPRSSSKVSSIRTKRLPKARSASSPAITDGRAAPRLTCASRKSASATIRP